MAADSRRQVPVLAGLLVVLAAVVWWQMSGSGPTTPATPTGRTAAARQPAGGRAAQTPDDVLAKGVGLDRLDEDRPAPEEGGRDPFRSGAVGSGGSGGGAETRVPSAPTPAPVAPAVPAGPPGPPPVPPISVKFIGIVSRQDVGRVAVLSDGKNVYYGRAGEIVDGRWRIVSIGEESLQIEYADGRGRQTVRLSG